jgi:hypothetical protein
MKGIVSAEHATKGRLFAAFDASVHHVDPAVRSNRFGAWLAPYESREEAERALIAAGAVIGGDGG